MNFHSKAKVAFAQSKSDVDIGFYSFYVHPDDQVIFKHEMARLLKKTPGQPMAGIKNQPLVLEVKRYCNPKTRKQENMYRKILREICTQEQSDAYGSDPDNVHEGVLARACLSYGYPTITVGGLKVPQRSKQATTKELNLLMEVARVLAGELKADVSHIGLED